MRIVFLSYLTYPFHYGVPLSPVSIYVYRHLLDSFLYYSYQATVALALYSQQGREQIAVQTSTCMSKVNEKEMELLMEQGKTVVE